MSLMAINRTAKKYGWLVGAVMALLMIGGVVISGLGGNIGRPMQPIPGVDNKDEPVIATVGDRKVTKTELDTIANNLMRRDASNPMAMGRQPGPEQMDHYRLQGIDAIKQQQALAQVAKQAGISISDADLQTKRNDTWNKTTRAMVAQQLGLAPDADDAKISAALDKMNRGITLDSVKQQMLSDDTVRLQAMVDGLSNKYKSQIAADDAAVRKSLSDMTVRHILVKFGTGALPEAQAKTKAEKLLAAVKANPASMGTLATANSDDPGSKAKGGVYEWKPSDRANIVPEFAAALDTLKPGETYPELVRVVSPGYSGFHIIRLEAVKPGAEFPKDYDAKKATYAQNYIEQRVDKRVQQAVDAVAPSIPTTLSDPALQAEQDITDAGKAASTTERNAKLNDAIAKLSAVKKENDPLGLAPLKKGQIYTALGKNQEAVAAFEDALTYRTVPQIRLALAQAYVSTKQNDKAKEQLAEVEKGVIPEAGMYTQMASLYTSVGDTAKAKAAADKGKELQQKQLQDLLKQYQSQMPAQTKAASPAAPASKAK